MSSRDKKNNSKEKFIKLKSPLYFSPHIPKKHTNVTKLYTDSKNNYQVTDYNLSKNKLKQKINVKNLNKNALNIQLPDTFKKNSRIVSGISTKPSEEKNSQSHRKSNSKIYLKKNMVQNMSALNYTEENLGGKEDKNIKNRLDNIKFNIGKSSQNFLNSKISTTNLKKNAESAYELLDNNYLKKSSKTKPKKIPNINNISPIGFIYDSTNNKKEVPISPPPKMIYLKNEKNKEVLKIDTEKEEEKKEELNCVMRNTFTNVKIYPTTFLNSKIIYQNNNQSNNNKSEISNNTSTMNNNNSKIKKEKIVIYIENKKQKKKNENNKFESIEELHFYFVDKLQKGIAFSTNLDK